MSKMDIFKIGSRVTCAGCSQLYTTREGSYGRGARRPLLLTCGHTLCESCIYSNLSAGKDIIVCPVCTDPSMREHKDANIHADFPLSMFVLGAVTARYWTQSTADSQVAFVPPGASIRRYKGRVTEAPPTQQASSELCEECTTRPCDWFCQQCELKYCNSCFAKVHKAKALMKHMKMPPPVGKLKLKETQLCHTHKDKTLEFYCKQCDCNICAHCFVETHRSHDVISLFEKNKDCMETLEEAYEKGTNMLKQLISTQKKVESLRQASSKLQAASAAPYSRVEQEVVCHFSKLHGLLQRVEQQLLLELGEARAQHVDSLRTISRQLIDHLADVREALDNARVAMLPANLGLVDVASVQEKLRQILNLPCHLVTSVTGEANSVEFVLEDTFVEQLASHCRLELRSSVNHALMKSDDLPPDYVAEPLDESLPDGVCPSLTHSSRTSSVSALGEEVGVVQEQQQQQQPPSIQSPDSKKAMQFALHERQDNTGPNNTHPVINIALDPANRKKAKNILQGTSEAVVVTHIKDPCDFYVQLQSDQHKVLSQANAYKKLAAGSSSPTEVKPGEIYLVCYNVDKNWYRARVVSMLSPADGEKEQQFLVQYVDYGNFEKVALSSFRIAPKSVLQSPFMAIHCGLHGVNPAGGKWSPEGVKLFAQMVNGSVVMMVVLGYTADKYEVDLCRMPTGGDDVPSSVQDAVIFLGLAHYFNNIQRQSKQIAAKSDPFYSDKAGLKHGDIIDVTISHVENPSSFYVQKVDHSYLLMNNMMEKLREEYGTIGNKGLVYAPYINMPCAALYSLDKKWYRGKVLDLPGNRLVLVEYVDFGNKELVSWNKIRKLKDNYLQLPAQAIHCALNDVVPPAEMGAKWTTKSSNFLQQHTSNQITRMFVDAATVDVLKVTLYKVKPNVDICINALMVREGLARSTGISSSLVEFRKSVDDVENKKLKIPPLKGTLGQNSDIDKKEPPKPSPVQEAVVDDAVEDCDEEEHEEEEKGPLKVEVKVLSVVNPNHLYVSIVSQQKAINSMMEELQEFYQQCPKCDKEWTVGDPCAAYLKDKKLWYRAVIIDLPDNENCKVFLKDTADCQLVEVSCLRELSNMFTQLHDGAIRCHLAGIKPAGSSSTWSILATEFLTTLVSQDNMFSITKKGEVDNDSLPVELLVKEIVEEGPLIPTVEEWRAINNKLVEQGLAFVIRDGATSSVMSGGQQMLAALRRNTELEGVSVSQWLTTQKSSKSAGPRKSPKKLLTNTAVSDRSLSVKETIVKPEEQQPGMTTSLSDSMVAHASGAESDENTDPPEQGNLPPLFDSWLPAEPLPSNELWVVPTYVDMKCCIYFHDYRQEDKLTVIGNGLNSRFSNSKPKPFDSYWSPGQTCVALYHSDKKWYRGQVVSIKEDMTVEVMFVDYGNIEVCKASELRKNVCMTYIPVQCHSAKLHGIAPLSEDGMWPVKTLDFIHMTVVEKLCLAKLRTAATGEVLMVSLIGPGDLDFYQLLVNMHYAVLTYTSEDADSDGSDAVYIEAQEDAGEDVIIEEEVKEETASNVANEGEQSEVISSRSEEKHITTDSSLSIGETVSAEDRRRENVSVREVQSAGEGMFVASVDVTAECESDVKEDVCVKNEQQLEQRSSGDEPVGSSNVEEQEDTVSGMSSNSDASDKSEQQLPRKPQSLMDWYDIITEEEKRMTQLGDECEDESERVIYRAMELPELDSLLVEVTAMLSVNEVVLHLEKTETAELRLMKTKFEELTRILQVEAPTQDVLNDPSIGQPCCACYSEDRQWYRAMIVDVFDDLQVKIVYVDYGNTEIVSADSLREVSAEWLQLPVQGVQARLWRLLEAPDQDHSTVIHRLADSLFKPPVIANIQSRSPLMVQILSCKTLEPVYKPLFEDGLLVPENT